MEIINEVVSLILMVLDFIVGWRIDIVIDLIVIILLILLTTKKEAIPVKETLETHLIKECIIKGGK